ncbi:MAG: helix-turn-helix transcriptional regulator [Ruminococcaceae bacterium]|nr:helix-turn-helix transcriptional regulator [Oscillospiraceae bacterium]
MINFMKHDFIIDKIELACFVGAGKGTNIHKNRTSHGLAIFLGGDRTFYFDNKKIKVEKNTIVYFPKGSNYTIKEKECYDCYAINFQMPDNVIFEPFAFKVKNSSTYVESFKNSQRIWVKKKSGFTSKVKSELYNIIYNMQSEYNIPYSNSSIIQPAVDYIHSNYYKENISVTELANLCNISVVHLRNTFIKIFATSPIKYINSLKMSRAKELLTSGLYTVSDVCYLSGYNDESYFSREFKKFFNITPCEYAKASRN